ncbi:MAG: DUF507 family protein [Bdellovibrionales bacterium]|nr:DUF507 family protein [Bdellovibrionales bacterium]
MRLREEEIHRVVARILRVWQEEKLMKPLVSVPALQSALQSTFSSDLQVEDRLNEEVEKMLEAYKSQIDSGSIDRHKMFQMIKSQLIKERNLVI